jgi:hypothetical protein
MSVKNASHQDLDTCIYKSIYSHMKNKNLHCLIVSVSVATLPCSDSSPLILSRTKFAPRLTSKILQMRLTSRTEELIRLFSFEGQPARTILAQTCMCVFFILSLSHTMFTMLSLMKPLAGHRWSADHSFINTAIACMQLPFIS